MMLDSYSMMPIGRRLRYRHIYTDRVWLFVQPGQDVPPPLWPSEMSLKVFARDEYVDMLTDLSPRIHWLLPGENGGVS